MSYGIFDHLIASGFDMERIGSARDYFAKRRYQEMEANFAEEDGIVDKAKKTSNEKNNIKKNQSNNTAYDAEIEQERKEYCDLDKKIQRDTIYGMYIPRYMEKEM